MKKDAVAADNFDRRVQIQQQTLTPNSSGGQTQSWTTIYAPLADIQNMPHGRGLSRQFKFMQLYPTANTIIVIRYVPNLAISAKMRVVSVENNLTHIYQIIGPPVNLNRQNKNIYLPCMELQSVGVN